MLLANRPPPAISILSWILTGALLGCGAQPASAADVDDTSVSRLVVRMPPGTEPSPLIAFENLHDTNLRLMRGGTGVAVSSAPTLEALLRDAGAVAFGRLSDGLREWPAGWQATYVAVLDPPLSRKSAEQLVVQIHGCSHA